VAAAVVSPGPLRAAQAAPTETAESPAAAETAAGHLAVAAGPAAVAAAAVAAGGGSAKQRTGCLGGLQTAGRALHQKQRLMDLSISRA